MGNDIGIQNDVKQLIEFNSKTISQLKLSEIKSKVLIRPECEFEKKYNKYYLIKEPNIKLINFLKRLKRQNIDVEIELNGTNYKLISEIVKKNLCKTIVFNLYTYPLFSKYKSILETIKPEDIYEIKKSMRFLIFANLKILMMDLKKQKKLGFKLYFKTYSSKQNNKNELKWIENKMKTIIELLSEKIKLNSDKKEFVDIEHKIISLTDNLEGVFDINEIDLSNSIYNEISEEENFSDYFSF